MHANLLPGIEALEDSQELKNLLDVAAPILRQRSHMGAILETQGHIVPALRALEMIADAAAVLWGKEMTPGGHSPNIPRHELMVRLGAVFEEMFDRPPAVSSRFDHENETRSSSGNRMRG